MLTRTSCPIGSRTSRSTSSRPRRPSIRSRSPRRAIESFRKRGLSREGTVTQTVARSTVTSSTESPISIVSTSALVDGSIRDTVPSRRFATHTPPAPSRDPHRIVANCDCARRRTGLDVDLRDRVTRTVRDPYSSLSDRDLCGGRSESNPGHCSARRIDPHDRLAARDPHRAGSYSHAFRTAADLEGLDDVVGFRRNPANRTVETVDNPNRARLQPQRQSRR